MSSLRPRLMTIDAPRSGSGNQISVPFVDLEPMTRVVREPLLAALAELIETGVFVNGPAVTRFEEEFAACCGQRYQVSTRSWARTGLERPPFRSTYAATTSASTSRRRLLR